ncbi:integral membrane protein [Clathrospora elynae]|uniref:Integral membrane protein n=1 Tax=Clathrospora elynae TaxID=706981 RepID=A0A6A5SY16_9PLEO|nr:integral membrane protein [Clathrospora elynae]
MDEKPIQCKLTRNRIVANNDLRISFRRNIRVSDNHQTSLLPLDLGAYPFKSAAKHSTKMRADMAVKRRYLPYINFSCNNRDYMVKIYVGNVDAISGEPAEEDADTWLRRQAKLAKKNTHVDDAPPDQDYIVVSGQLWLDEIANADGTVRQFVTIHFGSSYSVESQIIGKDAAGSIQFEITSYEPRPVPKSTYLVFVKTLSSKTLSLYVKEEDMIDNMKSRSYDVNSDPLYRLRLVFAGKQLQKGRPLADYNIGPESTMHCVLRLLDRGLESEPEPEPKSGPEMSVAAGVNVKQTIFADSLGPDWQPGRTTVFNAQILNSAVYQAVIGEAPPTYSIDARTYKNQGLSFFKLSEELSGISGDFNMVNSIAEIDKSTDGVVEPRVFNIGSDVAFIPTGLINLNGPLRDFRTAQDLKEQYSSYHVANLLLDHMPAWRPTFHRATANR